MLRLFLLLGGGLISGCSIAADALTANFHAVVMPPTCDVAVKSGITGGAVHFDPVDTVAVTEDPVGQKEFDFNVSCGAMAGKQLRFTMSAQKTSSHSTFIFVDDDSTAKNVGFAARMGTGTSCSLTWHNSSCVVLDNNAAINIASAGTAASNAVVWVKAGLSRGGFTDKTTAGTVKATLTFTADYP